MVKCTYVGPYPSVIVRGVGTVKRGEEADIPESAITEAWERVKDAPKAKKTNKKDGE